MKLSIVADAEAEAAPPPGAALRTIGGRAPVPAPLHVFKFGSSVLRTPADLAVVAGELYRRRRDGARIVAVVSAFAGETDRLLAEAAAAAGGSDCAGVADLVSLGEQRVAAALRIACDRIGLRALLCGPEELGLRVESEIPVALDPCCIGRKLDETGLVIVPGFVGMDGEGRRTLLGRGGSDYSAIFIAGELGAECARLYKDVDGVFDRDPARSRDARRFETVSWDEALRVARPLIQPQSLEYAAAKRLPIEVEAIGSSNPTRVGPCTGAPRPAQAARPLRVAIAGYGVVGQALAARLAAEPRFEIAAILARDVAKPRAVPPPVPPTADPELFLAAGADVIVDLLSCDATGASLCARALPAGIHVVSAGKRVVSAGLTGYAKAAAASGAEFLYSAAVGGAATVIETVCRAAAQAPVREVAGILNGTVNFILDRLHRGLSFEAALAEAQAAGFAEADSEADLSGADAAAKLRLVAHAAFGIDPATVSVETERLDAEIAARIAASGERWVQLARIDRAGASVALRPSSAVPGLPEAPAEWNAAVVRLEDGSEHACVGRGAGGAPTAEAVLADLFDVLRAAPPESPALAAAC